MVSQVQGGEKAMIGHVALFVAALVAAAAGALGFPSRTGTEGCLAQVVSSPTAVGTPTNARPHHVTVGSQKPAPVAFGPQSRCARPPKRSHPAGRAQSPPPQ